MLTSRPLSVISFCIAVVLALFLGTKIGQGQLSIAFVIIPFTFAACVLYASNSITGVYIIGCGVYAGTIGLFNSIGAGLPGLQLHDAITISQAGIAFIIVFTSHSMHKSWLRSDGFLLLFLIWAGMRSFQSPQLLDAARDMLFFSSFWLTAMVARLYETERANNSSRAGGSILAGAIISLLLSTAFIATGFGAWTSLGLATPLGKRPLALFLVVALSVSLSWWLYPTSSKQKRYGFVISALCGGLILLTLSRTVILTVGLIHVPFMFLIRNDRPLMSPINLLRVSLYLVAIVLLASVCLKSGIAQERFFFDQGTASYSEMLQLRNLNTMGRSNVWPIVYRACLQAPIIGHGTGAVRSFAKMLCGWDHPHNDYLRVFYDQGLVGLSLFSLYWIGKIRNLRRIWGGQKISPELAQSSLAALTATLVIVLSFITDNTIVYTYAMLPLAILIGTAEARAECEESQGSDEEQNPTITCSSRSLQRAKKRAES